MIRISVLAVAALAATPALAQPQFTGADVVSILTWVEENTGKRPTLPMPQFVEMPGSVMDEMASDPGTVYGHYDPTSNVIMIRAGMGRGETLTSVAHEIAHYVWADGFCDRQSELFAYQVEFAWAAENGLSQFAGAGSLDVSNLSCLGDEIRKELE